MKHDLLDVEVIDHVLNPPVPAPQPSEEVRRLRNRLEVEQRARWAAEAQLLDGPAAARIIGRVVRIDARSENVAYKQVWLAVEDEGDRYQAIRIYAASVDLMGVFEGALVQLAVIWRRGRLTVEEIESIVWVDSPVPEVRLPEFGPHDSGRVPSWFDSKATNQPRNMLKSADGSSSVSELRVHVVWATKRRGKVLTAPMIARLKVLMAEAVKEKGLGKLLAVNGENDHIHVALWLPANLAGSEAAGILKSYTSRILRREFPELKAHHDEALWQRGCFVGSIGVAGHLEAVLNYIKTQQALPQTLQDELEGLADGAEEEDERIEESRAPGGAQEPCESPGMPNCLHH